MPHISGVFAPIVPHSVRTRVADMALKELKATGAECSSGAGTAALKKLQQTLISAADIQMPARIAVVRHTMPNAFALPDGRVVIFSALLKDASGPDELAGVLAHELGHVKEDHAGEGLVQMLGLRFFMLLMTGSADTADTRRLAELVIHTSYQRDKEREADHIAIETLHNAGISTEGFVHFFENQAKDMGSGLFSYLSSHPSNEERIAEIKRLSKTPTHAASTVLSASEWQDLKAICQ